MQESNAQLPPPLRAAALEPHDQVHVLSGDRGAVPPALAEASSSAIPQIPEAQPTVHGAVAPSSHHAAAPCPAPTPSAPSEASQPRARPPVVAEPGSSEQHPQGPPFGLRSAIHFHLPVTRDRISQLASATPDDMQAISNFFTQIVQGVTQVVRPDGGHQAWHHDAPTPDFKVRWERAAQHFSRLPLVVYYDQATLERMSVKDLKNIATERGLPLTGLLEKADVVARLLEGADKSSSCDTCPICSDEYVAGEDMLRVLPCTHRFHVECCDRWFLNPVDYSQKPSCPLCKAELSVPG